MECSLDGKPGFKYGESGHCYTYTEGDEAGKNAARAKAAKQGQAIEISRHGFGQQSEIRIELNSGIIEETDTEIIIRNAAVMATGVFNGKKKIAEELSKSVRWWNGLPITLQTNDKLEDHPETGIVTSRTIRVGQVLNPAWNAEKLLINADCHFIRDQTPEWLQNDIRSQKPIGVSGAYFCDFVEENGESEGKKYDAIEINYAPNNLAIVKHPACKPPRCGLNVNTADPVYTRLDGTTTTNFYINYPQTTAAPLWASSTGGPIANNLEENKMEEKETKDYTAEIIQLNEDLKSKDAIILEKDQKIVMLEAENVKLNAQVKEYADKEAAMKLEAKKKAFLDQFPEQNRAKAESELLQTFLEKPEELTLNASKIAELMKSPEPKLDGKEFIPEKNSDDLGLPDAKDIKIF